MSSTVIIILSQKSTETFLLYTGLQHGLHFIPGVLWDFQGASCIQYLPSGHSTLSLKSHTMLARDFIPF